MVTVNEATDIVLSHLYSPAVENISISHSVGRVLGEIIIADRDFPPFNRVAMDGIAIEYESWKNGQREFTIEQVQAAGEPQKKLTETSSCIEVMTGSMLPEGTDTVIRYEDVEIAGNKAIVKGDNISAGQNIHRKGNDAKRGSVLLETGIILSSAEIALLASVGKPEVKVMKFPTTAIISSGDELVEIDRTPLPHQIRRSNTFAVEAAMQQMKWNGTQFHLPDRKEELKQLLHDIAAQHEVIILSGGVSKGKFDFIPEVLELIGVRKLFHQVSQRPGKPFWFGVSESGKTVFALPGNPVSTYMCFYRYIKPWIMKSLGVTNEPQFATLAREVLFPPNLTYFLQVNVVHEDGKLMAYPDPGGGSGDFANLKNVTGFLELPQRQTKFEAGKIFPYIPFR